MIDQLDARLHADVGGAGPGLLLLHGFAAGALTWAPLLPSWTPRFTTIAVDLPGHGRSVWPAGHAAYSMEGTVALLARLLDNLGFERAALLGYSMGGRVALHFAAAHPERVWALVLESSTAGLDDSAEREARVAADEALAERIEREGVRAFVDHWERLPLFATQGRLPGDALARQRRLRLSNDAGGLAWSLRGMGTGAQEPLWDRLGGMRVPALLLAGAEDAKFSAVAGRMAAALPRSELVIVPEAGHAIHLERPELFAETVLRFLLRAAEESSVTS